MSICFFFLAYFCFYRIWLYSDDSMYDGFCEIDERSGNISYKLFWIFYKKSIKFLFDLHIHEIDIGHECSDSEYNEYKNTTAEKNISHNADEKKKSPKQKRFFYPPIRLVETMCAIPQIDIVDREIFENNIFFVALDSICFYLIITSFHQTYIGKYTDNGHNQQKN